MQGLKFINMQDQNPKMINALLTNLNKDEVGKN